MASTFVRRRRQLYHLWVTGWIIPSLVVDRMLNSFVDRRKGGGTATELRRLAARSRGWNKVAFPLNLSAAKTTNIPTLRLQPLNLLFVFGRTTK